MQINTHKYYVCTYVCIYKNINLHRHMKKNQRPKNYRMSKVPNNYTQRFQKCKLHAFLGS